MAMTGVGKSDAASMLASFSDHMFSKKMNLDNLHQILAEEAHPARATFTTTRIDGDEYVRDMYESTPCQNRRDLAYAMGALTRPDDRMWFDFKATEEYRNTERAKTWLVKARDKQRTQLYNRNAAFQTAMHEGDNDFVTFGNAIHGHFESKWRNRLVVYSTYHPRDCAWADDESRHVNEVHRKFKFSLSNWAGQFPGLEMPAKYRALISGKTPHVDIELRHICFPKGRYDCYSSRSNLPWESIYLDPNEQMIVKQEGYFEFPYTVRRWILGENSAYGYSPASMLGLVDSRLLQSQARVILEAGERQVDPPMIARAEGVLGEVMNYPGYVNWIDANYDERNGEALRAIRTEANIPLGLEMKIDTRNILAAAWFINKLSLPAEQNMTAFEVNERISEYIRSIGPAVKPFEVDNAQLLDVSFNMNLRLGHFGPPQSIPPELRMAEVGYEFDGPIQMAYKRQELQKAREVVVFAGEAVKATGRPEIFDNYDFDRITRDATEAIGGKPEWLKPLDAVKSMREAATAAAEKVQQAQQQEQMLGAAHGIADLVPKIAQANQAMPVIEQGGEGGGQASSPYPVDEEADVAAA
jgi:hypothetical protein